MSEELLTELRAVPTQYNEYYQQLSTGYTAEIKVPEYTTETLAEALTKKTDLSEYKGQASLNPYYLNEALQGAKVGYALTVMEETAQNFAIGVVRHDQ